MTDAGERTEQATPKRLKEAREKGRLGISRDLLAWTTIGVVAVTIPATISNAANATADTLFHVREVAAAPDPAVALSIFIDGLGSLGGILALPLGVAVAAVLVGAVVQGGLRFRAFQLKGEQFNVLRGMGRLFGTQALWEGAKSLLKTAVVGAVLYMTIQGLVPTLAQAGGLSISSIISAADDASAALIRAAVVAGLGLAAIDVFVVIRRNRKQTRMTKREVKDEHKSQDGDPLVRSQRRSRQLAMSRTRMISAVGDADVVLLNPTHLAVALQYIPGRSAPRVLAKGRGLVATRIRQRATDVGVPMVRDIPLARALYASCEVGQEIPEELYEAVARVLALVMSLRARGAARGIHSSEGKKER